MEQRKNHGEHNEKLSLQLYEGGIFLDWSCTTAFYAALHFVSCRILPNNYNGKNCKTVDEAMKQLNAINKHEATAQMVFINLPAISADYNFLMDISFTARYYNYQVDKHHAKLCKKKLRRIKEVCFPEN